jgi:hypothetical protein
MSVGLLTTRPQDVDIQQLLRRLDQAWIAFKDSYFGLSELEIMEPGVTKAWSVRDIIAHVTTWEEEALKHLPGNPRGPKAATLRCHAWWHR